MLSEIKNDDPSGFITSYCYLTLAFFIAIRIHIEWVSGVHIPFFMKSTQLIQISCQIPSSFTEDELFSIQNSLVALNDKSKTMLGDFQETYTFLNDYFMRKQFKAMNDPRSFKPIGFRLLVSLIYDRIYDEIEEDYLMNVLDILAGWPRISWET